MNYLHIGFERSVRTSDIVGVFDVDSTTVSSVSREFLKNAEKDGSLADFRDRLPKSFIITQNNNIKKIFLSPLATSTLKQRLCLQERKEEANV